MESKNLKFKTNINCGGCVATVKPYLDAASGVNEWEVDTGNKDKILTVKADSVTADEVMAVVKKAGFKIESIND